MRRLLALLLGLAAACSEPKTPPPPPEATQGACDNGALLGSKRVDCAFGNACILGSDGPKCVPPAEAELREPCGKIECGSGCSCSSNQNECTCAQLGAPAGKS